MSLIKRAGVAGKPYSGTVGGRSYAAPVATMRATSSAGSRSRVKVYAVTETPWPHVELRARIGGLDVTLDLSAREALALADGIRQAVETALPHEIAP